MTAVTVHAAVVARPGPLSDNGARFLPEGKQHEETCRPAGRCHCHDDGVADVAPGKPDAVGFEAQVQRGGDAGNAGFVVQRQPGLPRRQAGGADELRSVRSAGTACDQHETGQGQRET